MKEERKETWGIADECLMVQRETVMKANSTLEERKREQWMIEREKEKNRVFECFWFGCSYKGWGGEEIKQARLSIIILEIII